MPTQYRFGDFKLLPAERLLFKRDAEVALAPRPFALLVALVENAGKLLTRNELMRRVWVGVVVEDNSLAVQIVALRKLLGPDTITTIAGRGYRFALDVIDLSDDASGAGALAPSFGQGNLPARLPALVGRGAELGTLAALVDTEALVTICGAPGIGKTRLAQALALAVKARYADGAWWIELAPLATGASVAAAIASTLGIEIVPGTDVLRTLTQRLAGAATLIVLDNAEHLAAEVSRLVAALVRETQRTSIVVTSQVPLHAPGERLVRLEPLLLADAVQLLAERATEAGAAAWEAKDAERAAEICRSLDRNPLAIELAAARIDALGIEGLSLRLQQRLTLLTPTVAHEVRRNGLATTLEWSHELLGAAERQVLHRLAVFPAGFSLELAAVALADDVLPAERVVETVLTLVDRSLVAVDRLPVRRFRLLETTRLYALAKLGATGEAARAQRRFCAGLRWLFDEAYQTSWLAPPSAWRARYETELSNLWTALSWATQHDLPTAVALFGSSWPVWSLAHHAEARPFADALASRLDEDEAGEVAAPVRARFWQAVSHCHIAGCPALARAAAERASTIYSGLGDARGEYLALVVCVLGQAVGGTEAHIALARAKALEDPDWPASVLERGWSFEAGLQVAEGRMEQARATFEAALAFSERRGHELGVLRCLLNLAELERIVGRIDEAVRLGGLLRERMNGEARSVRMLTTTLLNWIGALIEQGRPERACEAALECRRRAGRLVLDDCSWPHLDTLALLHLHAGRDANAARLAGASEHEYSVHGLAERQHCEARDRTLLVGKLQQRLGVAEFARLHAEGERLSRGDAVELAFALDEGGLQCGSVAPSARVGAD